MDGTSYTTISNALKNDYLPNLHRQIDKLVQTWDIFSKKQDGVKGRDIYMKMFKEYPQGVGAAAAGESLPTPTGAGYEEAKVTSKRNYATLQLDAMLEKDKTGIVDLVDFEMKALTESLQRELNFQLAFGDGTGARAQVSAASDGDPSITLDAGDGTYSGHEYDFLYPNMSIDVYGGATKRGTYIIDYIDSANSKAYLKSGTPVTDGVLDNDLVYRAGQKDIVMMGLRGIVAGSGALQTLNPATSGQEWWKSYVKDKGAKWGTDGADFLDSIDETIDEIELNSIGKVNLIYGWPLFGRQYKYVLEAKRQIINSLEFKAGRKGIAHVNYDKEIPILRDKYLPHNKVFFLDTNLLAIYTLDGIHWEEHGGGVLKVLEMKDVYAAWLRLYSEFGTTTRNGLGLWTNTGTTVGDYT